MTGAPYTLGKNDTMSANITALTAGNITAQSAGQWSIDFRIGGPEQHAGTLRANRLYKKLVLAFEVLSKTKDLDQCKEDIPDFCKNIVWCCAKDYHIGNVVYDAEGKYATNAYLRVQF
jgi:hypothetical protein